MNQGSLAIAENGSGLAKKGSGKDQMLRQGIKSITKGTAVMAQAGAVNGREGLTEASVRAQ